MPLNSTYPFAAASAAVFAVRPVGASAPSAKLSFNINAFNGNTTNFNRCPAPRAKAMLTQMPSAPVKTHVLPNTINKNLFR